MKKESETYSSEELALFQLLEAEIDDGEYKPLLVEELEGARLLYKQVAVDTLRQKVVKYQIK